MKNPSITKLKKSILYILLSIPLFVTLIIITFTILITILQNLETKTYTFTTKQQTQELSNKGWIPSDVILPTATDINIKYDLDTNNVWMKYSYTEEFDISMFTKPISSVPSNTLRENDAHEDWWLDYKIIYEENISTYRYDYFEVSRLRYMVVDSESKTVYYWSMDNLDD